MSAMTRHTDCHAGQQQQPGYRLPETDGAKVLPTSDQVGLYLASIHQMAPPEHTKYWSGFIFQLKYSRIKNVIIFVSLSFQVNIKFARYNVA